MIRLLPMFLVRPRARSTLVPAGYRGALCAPASASAVALSDVLRNQLGTVAQPGAPVESVEFDGFTWSVLNGPHTCLAASALC